MPWQPLYAPPNWTPEHFSAASIADVARNIWAQQMAQQKQIQQGVSSLADVINKQKQDDVANAIMYSHEYNVSLSQVTPDQVPDYGGTSALAMNIKQMQADQYRTYTTEVGGETYPLTNDQRVRLAIAAQIHGRGRGGQGEVDQTQLGVQPDPSGSGMMGVYGANGMWRPLPGWAQSSAMQGKGGGASANRLLLEEQKSLIARQNVLTKLSNEERARNVE